MKTSILSKLSLIQRSISQPLKKELLSYLSVPYPSQKIHYKENLLNIYASFLFVQDIENFNAIEIFSDTTALSKHLDELVGFIYTQGMISTGMKYYYSHGLLKTFTLLTQDKAISFTPSKLSKVKVNDYALACVLKFELLTINEVKAQYLNGWQITSQDHKQQPLDLNAIYVKYGYDFTNKIYSAIHNYSLTQKYSTLQTRKLDLLILLNAFAEIDSGNNTESLEIQLSERYVQAFFLKAYRFQLAACLASQNNIKFFHVQWKQAVATYTSVFIDTKVFDAPLQPFVTPECKATTSKTPSFSVGGKPKVNEKLRWFADIPLKIRDDEAVAIIRERIDRDMLHLKSVLMSRFEELKKRQSRNKQFIEVGTVKPLMGNQGSNLIINSNGIAVYPIGEQHLESTIATFYHYGLGGYSGVAYDRFLGYSGNIDNLIDELNLPTNKTLFVLTALLVFEHPKITPSWLNKLEISNGNGKASGYIEVGNQFILTSEKGRRGRNLAQQDVILNDFSKSIVDFIVEHTELARHRLKEKGNTNWKTLLLTCTINKAAMVTFDYREIRSFLHTLLTEKAHMPECHDLSIDDLNHIAEVSTHRSIRRHRGMQIYIETHSQDAVADALGHKKTNTALLQSYLPQPLVDFLTERVVRQYQNAIILKAMEDSPYLLDAVNMSYEGISEFLENHGLSEIPDFNTTGFYATNDNEATSLFDSIVYTISVPLVQLLIAIKAIVDSDDDERTFMELVTHWYQSASYLLNRFSSGEFGANDDIEVMYHEAMKNPLDTTLIKGAISY